MFCVVRSKTIKYVLVVLLASILLAISINGAVSAEVFFGYSTKKVPIYCVDTPKKQVAITFDAAWGADKTKQIVDICKEYNIRELADILEVVYALAKNMGVSKTELEDLRLKKANSRGGFEEKILLKWVEGKE